VTRNSNNKWTPEEDGQLREWLASDLTPFSIAAKLKRTTAAVVARAHALKISTKRAAVPSQSEKKTIYNDEDLRLRVGVVIKLSAVGSERCPGLSHKTGVIVRAGDDTMKVWVRFYGNKTPTALHRDYVEPIGALKAVPE